MKITQKERFDRKWIEDADTGCWLWLHAVDDKGYGFFWSGNRMHRAHRISYEMEFGAIPERMTIDHLCRNRECVNPKHMEVVSPEVNVSRSWRYRNRKSICINGHSYSVLGEYYSIRKGRVDRHCLECLRTYRKRKAMSQ